MGFYLKKGTGHAGGRAVLCWARIWLCWARWAGLRVGFGRAGCAALGWAWGLALVGVGRRFGFLSMVYMVHDLLMSFCLFSCVSQTCIMYVSGCCARYLI